jgi:hypothetical protein
MMGYTGSAIVAIAAAAASASASAYGAYQQNQNVKKAKKSANEAAAINTRQLDEQAAVERMKREQESQRIKAAIRVASTAAGAGFEQSSYSALVTQTEFDRTTNEAIADRGVDNNLARIASGLRANMNELDSRRQNVLVSGILGGIQGAQAGFGLAQGFRDLFAPTTPEAGPTLDWSYQPGSTQYGSNRPR